MPANGPHPCSGWNISSGGKVIHFPHQSLVCHLKFATRVPFNASHCGGFHSSVQARDSSRQQQPLSKEVYTVEMIVIYTVHWCTESWYIFYLIKLDIQEHFAGQGGKHLQRTSPGGWPKKKAGKSGESKNGWPIRVEREKKSNGTAIQHPLEVGTQNNLPVCPPLELALLASNVSEINLHQQDVMVL